MKIVITGGAGFIASHIADAYIALGHEVWIIDNLSTGKQENIPEKAHFIKMDVNDPAIHDLFSQEKFDIINHHAAQMDVRVSVNDPSHDARINILGGINIYEAAKNSGVKKIIFASSGGTVYGEQEIFPADESHPTKPISPYGVAKLSMNIICIITMLFMVFHMLLLDMLMCMDQGKIPMEKQVLSQFLLKNY